MSAVKNNQASVTKSEAKRVPLNAMELAAKHAIEWEKPSGDFFQGSLLGNGKMGVVVCAKPDAVLLHFAHNSIYDIRAEFIPMEKLGTFEDLWGKFKRGDRDWVEPYNQAAVEPAEKHPYPRSWNCGTLLMAFDRRDAELLGHTLHLEEGKCRVHFLVGEVRHHLEVFVEMNRDRLWMRMVNDAGKEVEAPFLRVKMSSQPEMPAVVWDDAHGSTFRQELFGLIPDPNKDQALRMSYQTTYLRLPEETKQPFQLAPPTIKKSGPFIACVEMDHGLAKVIPKEIATLPELNAKRWEDAASANRKLWQDYWDRSAIQLDDRVLEGAWYRNQYFMNCVARPGTICPTIYGNWSSTEIGTVWHGEYVFDYNTQQLFWGTFSSNRLENNIPYVDLIEMVLPLAKRWAKDFYQSPGAFIAQRHWPVETPTIPVPWFGWGNHHSPGPWAMQGLWWHYCYTMDKTFLRERAFGPIKEVTLFMNAYMRRADAHGATSPWKDDKFHIHPSQSPEIWPMFFGEMNYSDPIADLALTKFLFRSYLQACEALGVEQEEGVLMREVKEILEHFPNYATAESPRGGKVYIDVAGSPPDAIYNVANPLMPVFPGEEVGLHSSKEVLALAANTWRNQQNEGGNDLVMIPLQGARLGLLDLEKFKRQLNFCLLPNGTYTDMTLQAGGRYEDKMPNEYMARMGIWVENFAVPAVINECLLQSYTGELRFFPNWKQANGDARFENLRTVGAFLVSAEFSEETTQWIRIVSEAGGALKIINPWSGKVRVTRQGAEETVAGEKINLTTSVGEVIELSRG